MIKVTGRFQANMADPIRAAAIRGLGLVMLPRYIVGRDIQKGKLKVVLENYPRSPWGFMPFILIENTCRQRLELFWNFYRTG